MQLIDTATKNNVLASMITILNTSRAEILEANRQDLKTFDKDDKALYDRLVIDNKKIDGMIQSVREVLEQEDPVNQIISEIQMDSGLKIINRTDPFGTILIIYESRPDVTIEAAVLAFKANNKILLKGGKEALCSNKILVKCWHQALIENNIDTDWITMLQLDREQTRQFLRQPSQALDLIVPRGGEGLISFVKAHATCAVLVSGRGNNFLYVSKNADWTKSLQVIINAKTHKISACNALDKVLIDQALPDLESRLKQLTETLSAHTVKIVSYDTYPPLSEHVTSTNDEKIWDEEFLSMKIMISTVASMEDAISLINRHSGHHSNVIMTEDNNEADQFMKLVDSAAVYHNASSRFTDGGQMGVGAELAISTDKLHHRGPLGLRQLVTNKYYIYGDGHIRK